MPQGQQMRAGRQHKDTIQLMILIGCVGRFIGMDWKEYLVTLWDSTKVVVAISWIFNNLDKKWGGIVRRHVAISECNGYNFQLMFCNANVKKMKQNRRLQRLFRRSSLDMVRTSWWFRRLLIDRV
jgi:hypothetical protein